MIIETSAGVPMDARLFNNYVRSLINRFFKILPIKENGDEYSEESLVRNRLLINKCLTQYEIEALERCL